MVPGCSLGRRCRSLNWLPRYYTSIILLERTLILGLGGSLRVGPPMTLDIHASQHTQHSTFDRARAGKKQLLYCYGCVSYARCEVCTNYSATFGWKKNKTIRTPLICSGLRLRISYREALQRHNDLEFYTIPIPVHR